MTIVYLISILIGITAQNVAKKEYNRKNGDKGVYLFSALTSLVALIFFLLTSKDLSFDPGILPYSLLFALSYATATVSTVIAFSCGPMSLSSLINSYSLMIPTLYGLIVLHDPIGKGLIPGIVLLLLSLLLINKPTEHVPITPKWVISITLSFLGNGLCSTFQKMQQVAHDGAYKSEFMLVALALVVLMLGAISLATERGHLASSFKNGFWLGVLGGGMNGMVNLFVMLLSGLMAASVMFPVISAGGLVLTFVLSLTLYKEKLSRRQLVGFVLGLASIVLLNI